jgi:short-subunit dehydrogenase
MNNKYIVITGASGGIGIALVKKFLSCVYNVVAISRNIINLEHLKQAHPNLQIIQADINNDEDRKKVFLELNNKVISIINNAAYSGIPKAFKDMQIEDLRLFFDFDKIPLVESKNKVKKKKTINE